MLGATRPDRIAYGLAVSVALLTGSAVGVTAQGLLQWARPVRNPGRREAP